jgi:hypothetical protein
VDRVALAAGEETFELEVEGRKIRIVTRDADENLSRLFDLRETHAWDDDSPLTDADVATVVRHLFDTAGARSQPIEIVGVAPAAAQAFPNDRRISVSRVEPTSFSLPGSPNGLAFQMDEHGDGSLWAIGTERVALGSEGMWWIVNTLVDALEDPGRAARWSRILVLGTTLGGPAVQARLEMGGWGVGIVWRQLDNGLVGDIVAVNELTYERVDGWLSILRPFRDKLVAERAHRQRLRPARTAEKWVRAIERWSGDEAS